MALHEVRCPTCDALFRLTDTQLGKLLRCGKCKNTFTPPAAAAPVLAKAVPPQTPAADDELIILDDPAPAAAPPPADVPVIAPRRARVAGVAPPPAEDKPTYGLKSEKDRPAEPRPKSRRRDDDDSDSGDDRPARATKSKKAGKVVRTAKAEPAADGSAPPKFKERKAADDDDAPPTRPSRAPVLGFVAAVGLVLAAGVAVVAYALTGGPPDPAAVAANPAAPGDGDPGVMNWPDAPPPGLVRLGNAPIDPDAVADPAGEGGDWGDGRPNPFFNNAPNPGGVPRAFEPRVVPVNPPPPPPRPPFRAAAAVRPALTPAPMAADRVEIPLPAPADDAIVGGGGRFLFLAVPGLQQVVAFDTAAGKIVKILPTAGDRFLLAATADTLFAYDPGTGEVERWALPGLARGRAVKPKLPGAVIGFAAGNASAGPLLFITDRPEPQNRFVFADAATLELVDVRPAGGDRDIRFGNNRVLNLRAAADGTLFTFTEDNRRWTVLARDGDRWGTKPAQWKDGAGVDNFENLSPAADGRTVYATGLFFDRAGDPLVKKKGQHGSALWFVPAAEGPYYVSLAQVPGADGNASSFKIGVHDDRAAAPFVILPKLPEADALVDWIGGTYPPLDKHVFLFPTAKLLVVLPRAKDKLVIRRYDPVAQWDAAGVNYLFVASRPPAAPPGKFFDYPIDVKSKKGGVWFALEAAPPGVAVTKAGRVTWEVPPRLPAPAEVRVKISDASGQEVTHAFAFDAAGNPTTTSTAAAAKPPPLVRPADRAWPLKPPADLANSPVPLPAPATDAVAAGGGRFLIFRLPATKQLVVFDTAAARVVKLLPVPEANVLIAAGMEHLFVYLPAADSIQRWNLETLALETTLPNPAGRPIRGLAMGHAANGPLAAAVDPDGFGYVLLDPKTLGVAYEAPDAGRNLGARGGRPRIRASGDGRQLVLWGPPRAGGGGLYAATLGGDGVTARTARTTVGYAVPDDAGGTFFTPHGAVKWDDLANGNVIRNLTTPPAVVPATAGPFRVAAVSANPDAPRPRPGRPDPVAGLHVVGPDGVILARRTDPPALAAAARLFERPEALAAEVAADPDRLPPDRTVFLIPGAKLLVIVGETGDRLHFSTFDPAAAVAALPADTKFLAVTSRPPGVAFRGTTFSYTPEILSRAGGVTIKLDAAPDGMTAAGGTITWAVPAGHKVPEEAVIVSATDAGGNQTFQTFRLTVAPRAAAPARPLDAQPPRP